MYGGSGRQSTTPADATEELQREALHHLMITIHHQIEPDYILIAACRCTCQYSQGTGRWFSYHDYFVCTINSQSGGPVASDVERGRQDLDPRMTHACMSRSTPRLGRQDCLLPATSRLNLHLLVFLVILGFLPSNVIDHRWANQVHSA